MTARAAGRRRADCWYDARISNSSEFPLLIQGGMGAAVSDWRLARAVAVAGQLGVVSGTGLDTMLVRRLQDGDPDGSVRRAMARFPAQDFVARVLERYFLPAGRAPGARYALLPLLDNEPSPERERLLILSAYVEVALAREGHDGPVGINLLTKIQMPTLPTLYGAMLAGVAYVLMGSGVPREIPGVLDRLAAREPARLHLEVEDEPAGAPPTWLAFDPRAHDDLTPGPLVRPRFLAIVASNLLATVLARKASGRVDGFVIEGPTAGGHNAPPRGAPVYDDEGQPLYGARDVVDLEQIRALGLPFWLAGGAGRADALARAHAEGAAGIQVGTLFAYCDESGMHAPLKREVLRRAARGEASVRTDPRASPTGYPFKRVRFAGEEAIPERQRICDLGGLRVACRQPDGRLAFRCPAEPERSFLSKGGRPEDLVGRECLCNGLLAVAGYAQPRAEGGEEPPVLTSGQDLERIGEFLQGREHYSAADVVEYLLAGVASYPA